MEGDSNSFQWISVLIIAGLLFCAAWLAVCETAFASVSRVRLKLAQE